MQYVIYQKNVPPFHTYLKLCLIWFINVYYVLCIIKLVVLN